MFSMLVAIDGSEHSDNAVRHAVRCAGQMREVRMLLLNVQPPPMAGEVSNLVSGEEVAAMHEERGKAALDRARALVAGSGIEPATEVALGRPAETIVERAAHHGCDLIVMGANRHGRVGTLVLGSVSNKVMNLSRVPVTVVK